ncbi:hypothetical protein [Micromonospora inositola]|uniref:hypothetical protein n=1 Tax=Micromonospora inositola TaxID=47865 RepID=UPI000B5ACBB2|nr:hypothetical protein [Micromonospora inositola]
MIYGGARRRREDQPRVCPGVAESCELLPLALLVLAQSGYQRAGMRTGQVRSSTSLLIGSWWRRRSQVWGMRWAACHPTVLATG